MERKELKRLIEWNAEHRKPLVVYGARQIGKTYLIKEIFAERYYKGSYIYIDFKKDNDVRDYINGNGKNNGPITDAKKIIEYLSLREKRIIDKNVLLIFDEIQEALPIITSLKYFKQDFNEIPVIASGSMVRIKIKRNQKVSNQHALEGFFFPVGAIEEMYVHPVSFEEYIYNANKLLYEKIVGAYNNKIPLDNSIHEMAMDELYRYLLIGGMPENVKMYLEGESIVNIRKNIISIFNDYLNDMDLYQVSKNFRASLLEKNLKSRDLVSPIDWLITAGAIYKSEQVKEVVTLPFNPDNESNYRLYLMDSGFFAYQSDINMSTFVDKNARNELSGAFFENYVASELKAYNLPLYFWKGKNDAEFEFLIKDSNVIVPIDVKKGKGQLNSLKKYKEHNKCKYVLKVSKNNFGFDDENKILTIPLYMFFVYLQNVVERNNSLF